MLTEFGGIAYVPESASERTWGYSRADGGPEFARMFETLLETVIHTPLFSGFCYTQFADTFQEANGLLTADRHAEDSARADRQGHAIPHAHRRRGLERAVQIEALR